YDQLRVTGANRTVTLTGTQLSVTSGPSLFKGATFTVIDNVDASTQVVGTFLDLPDAAIFNAGSVFYRVNYAAGTGNDVVLTVIDAIDFGDAPSAAQTGFASSYPTLVADNGAAHALSGPQLGANRDANANGIP